MEIWKDIYGYEGLYQISNLGRVKSLSRLVKNGKNHYKFATEKIRKVAINKKRNGYCEISLYKNNKEKRFKIHRLVAQAFIQNIFNKPEVNHIDGNKQNNKAENLEWVTSKENKKHAWENNLMSARHKCKRIKNLETNIEYESIISCSKIM